MVHPGSTPSPIGGWQGLVTRDGETIRVEVTDKLAIVVDGPNRKSVSTVFLPYPRAGYGGHELVLSSEHRYLAMFLYSGQSEVGYEVFTFRPELRHVLSFPYEYGEGLGPAISPDEKLIGLAWATNPELDLTELEGLEDAAETDEELIVDWARLRVQELPNGKASTCNIEVAVPIGFPTEGDESYYPEGLEFVGDHVEFRAWGETIRVPLPLPATLNLPGPKSR